MNVPVSHRPTSTLAVVSLTFSILTWFLLPFIGAVVAVICGHMARAEIRRMPPGAMEGDGMAIAGLVLGWVHLALCVLVVIFIMLLFGGIAFLASLGH